MDQAAVNHIVRGGSNFGPGAIERSKLMPEATVNVTGTLQSERRASARHIAVMLIAKLACADTQNVCRIRNISSTGARLETNMLLQLGQSISLELRSDLRTTGRVIWTKDGNMGVRFDDEIDVARYLMRTESKIDRMKARAPRYQCAAEVILVTDGGCFSCNLFDIGLSGAGLADLSTKAKVRPGSIIKLIADGISSHHANVAWVDGNRAGIKFRHPLKYTELHDWLLEYSTPQDSDSRAQRPEDYTLFQAPLIHANPASL